MKAYWKVTLCLTAVFLASAGIVLFATAGSVTTPTTGLVEDEALHSLLIGPEDLPPWEKVFDLVSSGRTGRNAPMPFEALSTDYVMNESWSGPIIRERNCVRRGKEVCEDYDHCTCMLGVLFGISVRFAIAGSPQEAADAASKQVHSYAVIAPEITGEQSVALFTDRAWYADSTRGFADDVTRRGIMTFTRKNVVARIHVGHRDGFEPQLVFDLAALLSRKIDAAAAGNPEPVPLLPPSGEEMRLDLESKWELKDIGGRLWGNESTTVGLQVGDGLPRVLPAKQIAPREYVVPLRHLAAVLDGKARTTVGAQEATAKVAGKTFVFRRDATEVQEGERALALSRPVEFREGQALVPLTFVEKMYGRQLSWELRGTTMLGRL